jgi:hypothetical protein
MLVESLELPQQRLLMLFMYHNNRHNYTAYTHIYGIRRLYIAVLVESLELPK